jgi:hypothetical protein
MEDIKHFTEAVERLTLGRLNKVTKRVTVKSIRIKIRKFMSQWQRETNLTISKEVYNSIAFINASAGLPTLKYQSIICLSTREKVY